MSRPDSRQIGQRQRELMMQRLETPSTYRILNADTVPALIGTLLEIRTMLGGLPENWQVHEIGDGNLNLVFIAELMS